MSFEIPSDDANLIRAMLGLPEGSNIPERVVDSYYDTKRAADRVALRLGPHEVLNVVMRARAQIAPEAPETVCSMARQGAVAPGDPVEVLWRYGRWHRAVFKYAKGDDVVVQIKGDKTAEERAFPPEKVRIP